MSISDFGFRIADCKTANAAARFGRHNPQSAIRNPQSGFTLIELMVALGLMALLMSMIATIFFQASQSFRMARASVEIHQNARAAFGMMLRDFAAATLCEYEDKQGYFALSWQPDLALSNPDAQFVETVTFTTLTDQAGARTSPQLALVRYTLERDGGEATMPDGTTKRSTYNLVKKVRFPRLPYYFCDMDEFNINASGTEFSASGGSIDEVQIVTDPNYAFTPGETVYSDVLALSVLSMHVRIFYEGHLINVVDAGRCTTGSAAGTLVDANKNWPTGAGTDMDPFTARLVGGDGTPHEAEGISAGNTSTQITVPGLPGGTANQTTYRIEDGTAFYNTPRWTEIPDRQTEDVPGAAAGTTYAVARMCPMLVIENVADISSMEVRMPYLVEVTLEMTDQRSRRFHTFTQRFHIPASEQ